MAHGTGSHNDRSDRGRVLYAGLHLLDRQLIDREGRLCGKVDDLDLRVDEETGLVHVSAILAGPGVLATRVGFTRLGWWLRHAHRLLENGDDTVIPFGRVVRINNHVDLAADLTELATYSTTRWVRDHVIAHIPGSRHEAE